MSFRALVPVKDEETRMLRDILHRLDALENGGALRGQVSFDSIIQIGDVLVSILDAGGTARTVQFENVLSGVTFTIPL